MSRRRKKRPPAVEYELGCQLTYEVVGQFKIFGSGVPLFAMTSKEIAILASIKNVGHQLARNTAAHELINRLCEEADRREYGDYPTVMMLRLCLEKYEIPIQELPFQELGIKGTVMPFMRGTTGQA